MIRPAKTRTKDQGFVSEAQETYRWLNKFLLTAVRMVLEGKFLSKTKQHPSVYATLWCCFVHLFRLKLHRQICKHILFSVTRKESRYSCYSEDKGDYR